MLGGVSKSRALMDRMGGAKAAFPHALLAFPICLAQELHAERAAEAEMAVPWLKVQEDSQPGPH